MPGRVDRPVNGHLLLSGDPGVAAHQADARTGDPVDLALVIPVVGDAVAAFEGARDIQVSGHGLARSAHRFGRAQYDSAAEQCLGGHAGPVRAVAADEFALNEQGSEPTLLRSVRDVLAHRSRADDDEIIGRFGHLYSSL